MLDVRGVGVTFDGARAVDGVDLLVAKGELVAVLGPSGSGKSTLLRVVAGLQVPGAGSVAVDGVDVTHAPPHERGIGLMFQAPTLFPHRDVAGNVEFGLRMAGVPATRRRDRVAELLAMVGLNGYEQRAVSTLSGGEAQRIALARALAPEPRLLLLDEPFGALDAELRARLVDEVGRLVRRLGLTVLAVTHDREEAYAMADRVVVLRDGRVVADGTPEQLWAAPPDAWVARFLGLPNVLDAVVRGGLACTAWGPVPAAAVAGGDGFVFVPTSWVQLGHHAGCEAVVVARAFRGEVVRLTLRDPVSGAEVIAEARPDRAPAVDTRTTVTLRPPPPPSTPR